ncbi:MAG: hypothetical protein JOS17DRAFT_768405 [Linnemannia elongata]|nr:MAG: hypothetical protein JOS17DRAFT_768405 [Linnemannia elongata]
MAQSKLGVRDGNPLLLFSLSSFILAPYSSSFLHSLSVLAPYYCSPGPGPCTMHSHASCHLLLFSLFICVLHSCVCMFVSHLLVSLDALLSHRFVTLIRISRVRTTHLPFPRTPVCNKHTTVGHVFHMSVQSNFSPFLRTFLSFFLVFFKVPSLVFLCFCFLQVDCSHLLVFFLLHKSGPCQPGFGYCFVPSATVRFSSHLPSLSYLTTSPTFIHKTKGWIREPPLWLNNADY